MRDNDEIGFYLSLIKKKMDKHMNEGLKKYDLTKTQRDILGYLHFTDKNPVIQKDIEEHFHISNPTVTGILNRLEQKGFIERKQSLKDKRVRTIVLTKKLDNRNQVKIKKISMIFHGFYCTLKIPEEKALFFRVV